MKFLVLMFFVPVSWSVSLPGEVGTRSHQEELFLVDFIFVFFFENENKPPMKEDCRVVLDIQKEKFPNRRLPWILTTLTEQILGKSWQINSFRIWNEPRHLQVKYWSQLIGPTNYRVPLK